MVKLLANYIILINLIGITLMFLDKRKAVKNRWRISENTLMLTSLIGGSLGILIGMYTFRHKTKHKKFTIGIPVLLIVNILCIIILLYIPYFST